MGLIPLQALDVSTGEWDFYTISISYGINDQVSNLVDWYVKVKFYITCLGALYDSHDLQLL